MLQSQDSLRNRARTDTSDGVPPGDPHETVEEEPELANNGGRSDSSAIEEQEDESEEVGEVNAFWRLYEIIIWYYRYFSNNLENIIDELTLRLFNFYFGVHQ
ncbi:uncharacterized protein LOC135165879 [Diachasmimorpha longicaudata]|uniref:uncharacterized protein LOC135165879 n=1 Tax=Diachasmimorpha longicaudata TaxID=58733 RepID=UPI0030B884A0